ncbi:MAG: protein kinase, partial [Planctomycetota bacterium]
FVDRLIRSKLMTAEEVEECDDTLDAAKNTSDAQTYAKALVEANVLTSFQAKAIYEARIKGLTFGEYIILDQLGKGGMGIVYRARHRRMDRLVAIKVLPRFAMATKGMVGRFYREVKTAGKLMHPNIVAALDASEDDGLHYLVMEYVEGQDLRKVLQQSGPLELEHAVDCILQAARGFQYAHEQGIIHRDIKPANLLIDGNGVVKILDMGLARATSVANEDLARSSSAAPLTEEQLSDSATNQAVSMHTILGQDTATHNDETWLTAAGEVMGTLDYMSPEQFTDSHNVDERGDIYSLGCTLYRLLTDRKPFAATTVGESFSAHRSAPIPALRKYRPDIPFQLETVFRRMLAKEPGERQNSMSQVIEELEEALTHLRAPQLQPAPRLYPDNATDSAAGISDSALSLAPPSTQHLRSTDRPKRRRAIPIGWIAAGSLALSLLVVYALTQSQYLGKEEASVASGAVPSSSTGKATEPTVTNPSLNSKAEPTEVSNTPLAEPSTEPNTPGEANEFPVNPNPKPPESSEEPDPLQARGEPELWQSTPNQRAIADGLDNAFGPFLPNANSFP